MRYARGYLKSMHSPLQQPMRSRQAQRERQPQLAEHDWGWLMGPRQRSDRQGQSTNGLMKFPSGAEAQLARLPLDGPRAMLSQPNGFTDCPLECMAVSTWPRSLRSAMDSKHQVIGAQ